MTDICLIFCICISGGSTAGGTAVITAAGGVAGKNLFFLSVLEGDANIADLACGSDVLRCGGVMGCLLLRFAGVVAGPSPVILGGSEFGTIRL